MGIEQFLLQRSKEEGKLEGKVEGKEEGRREKDIAFTRILLAQTDFSIEKIANMVGVTVSFVEKVKASL